MREAEKFGVRYLACCWHAELSAAFSLLNWWEHVEHQHHKANQLQIVTTRHADTFYFGSALMCTFIKNGKEQESRRR
jgi:hypothetical protein